MEDEFHWIAADACEQTGAASAVIFFVDEKGGIDLAGVAGLEGDPLERLIEAVKSPDHPVTRTARDGKTAFDVTPIAPGGPALRSHIAIFEPGTDRQVVGVLALAHQLPLDEDQRVAAEELAERAAESR